MIHILIRKSLLLFLLLPLAHRIQAQDRAHGGVQRPIDFIENKGQWRSDIRFRAEVPGGAVFVTDKGVVYNHTDPGDLQRIQKLVREKGTLRTADPALRTVRQHAYRVELVNALANCVVQTSDKRPYYHNYFIGKDPARWKGQVGLYGQIEQKNVYDGIDMVVYSRGAELKYDFVVAPGADPGQVVLRFEGVRPEISPEGHLKISTTVNEIVEEKPYAYQVIDGRKAEVKCVYRLNGNRLRFSLPESYDRRHVLVIDPSVVFATYSGGGGGWNYYTPQCTTYDKEGNLYSGVSISQSPWAGGAPALWPVTLGAFQTVWDENGMAYNKYNASGTTLLYATYYGATSGIYGSSGTVNPVAMIVNAQDELIIAGETNALDIPLTSGCYDNTLSAPLDEDFFVARFASSGTALLGATLVGNSGNDLLSMHNDLSSCDLALDAAGNIWVGGNTAAAGFPVTANACQPVYGGGNSDGVLFALNPICTQLLYSSFLGGSKADGIHSLVFNNAGRVVVAGSTESSNMPVTAGALHTAARGNTDGFAALADPVSGALLHATYLGTFAPDRAVFVQTDAADNVYVLGTTLGNYPITPGVHSQPDATLFIDKLSPDLGASLRSARVGSPQSKFLGMPRTFLLDRCGNTYIMCQAHASASMPTTGNALQTDPGPFWLTVLQPEFAGVFFASYYFYDTQTTSSSAMGLHRSDPQGWIYYSAITFGLSSVMMGTPGSYMPVSNGAAMDPLSFKLDLSEFARPDKSVHSSLQVKRCFEDSLLLRPSYADAINCSWNTGSTSDSLWADRSDLYVVRYNKPGDLCRTVYTDSIQVQLHPLPRLQTNGKSCENKAEGLAQAVVAGHNKTIYEYTWYRDDAIFKTHTSDSGSSVADLYPGMYVLHIRTSEGCDTTLTFKITELPGVTVAAGNDTTIAARGSVELWASGAAFYEWTPGQWLDNPLSDRPVATPQAPVVYTVTGRNEYGCTATANVRIDIHERFFIPSAFSPNGDGKNDEFRIVNFGYQELREFRVYNRWGQQVFYTVHGTKGWDGHYRSIPAEAGTYFYVIRVGMPGGEERILKGDVLLLR